MAPKAQLGGIKNITTNNWDDAKKLLSEEDQEIFGLAQTEQKDWKDLLQDVLHATDQRKIELLERERKASFSFRGKQIVLRDVMSKLAVWTDRFKEVGDAVVQLDPGHATLPWAIVRLLLVAPVKEEEMYGAAMEGVERAAEIISRCAILEELYLSVDSDIAGRLRRSLVDLYAAVLSFLSKAVRYFNYSARQKILKSFFTSKGAETWFSTVDVKQEEVEKNRLLADAERAKSMSELMHTTNDRQEQFVCESRKKDEKLRNMLEDFGVDMSKVKVQLADLRNCLKAEDQRKILESISKILHKSQHADLSKGRLASSGQWLLEKPEFRNWQEDTSSSILWLRGIPGSGKTKLTSLVIDSMRDERLAFFYCVRNPAEPERAMAQPILASLVEQLACADKRIVFDTIRLRYLEAIDGSERYEDVTWDIEESTRALIDLTSFHASTVLVLDALDEMRQSEVSDLLEALIKIMRESRGVVKIFFSSRDSGEINEQLEDHPSLRIDAQDNSNDIEAFVLENIRVVRGLKGPKRAALREEVIKTLINGANGMFRWVELQIQMLRRCEDPRDIKAKLGHLPETLEKSYWDVFEQIKRLGENAEKLATTTFQWLLCAHRKVNLELFAFLASTDLEDSDEPYTGDEILRVCLNLVEKDKDSTIRFAHLSVREFLENSLSKSKSTEFLAPQANARVASLCLMRESRHMKRLMNQEALESAGEPRTIMNRDEREREWENHYIFFLIDHVSSSGDLKSSEPLKSLIMDFVFEGSEISPGFQGFHTAIGTSQIHLSGIPTHSENLTFQAVVANHVIWTLDAFGLTEHEQLKVPGISGQQQHRFMDIAIRSKNFSMVEKMLYYGIHLDCISHEIAKSSAQDPHAPVKREICTNLEFLLAPLDTIEDERDLVIILRKRILQLSVILNEALELSLVQKKVEDVEAFEKLYSKLQAGIERIMKSLDATDGRANPRTLVQGVVNITLDLAHRLLGPDFKISWIDTMLRRNALYLCSQDLRSGAQIAKAIIAHGARVNMSDRDGYTPLWLGIYYSNTTFVQVLLENGADANGTDPSTTNTRLIEAVVSRKPNVKIVRALLEKGARVNDCNELANTPLHVATGNLDLEMVQILLENGADVNVRNKKENTPLQRAVNVTTHKAANRQHPKIVRLLLERGADVSARDWLLMTPLHQAAVRDDTEVVEILLSHGADVDARDVRGLTARGLAEKFGRTRVLQMLPEFDKFPWDREAQSRNEVSDASSTPGSKQDWTRGIEEFEEYIVNSWGDRYGVQLGIDLFGPD